MATSKLFVLTIQCFAFVVAINILSNGLDAQGALGRVKTNVNSETQKSKSRQHVDEDEHSKKNSSDSRTRKQKPGSINRVKTNVRTNRADHHHRPANPSKRRARNSRYRRQPGFAFGVSHSFNACPPPIVVHETYIQPVTPVPVYPPQSALILDPVPESIAPAPSFESGNLPIGDDWFQDTSSRFSATIGSDFDDLSQVGFGLLLQSPHSIGLDLSVATLRENGMNFRDHLWLGDANVVVECIRTPNFRGRIGVGVNWLGATGYSNSGFNLTAGLDWKLNSRLSIFGEGDIGSLGDADFWHTRLGLSRQLDRAEWVTGVDHYDIGGENLHTLFTGLQFRF